MLCFVLFCEALMFCCSDVTKGESCNCFECFCACIRHGGRAAGNNSSSFLCKPNRQTRAETFHSLGLWCLRRTSSLVFSKFYLFSLLGGSFRQSLVICLKSEVIAKQRNCRRVLREPDLVGMTVPSSKQDFLGPS